MTKNKTHQNRVREVAFARKISAAGSVMLLAGLAAQASTDYGPAIWRPPGCTKWNTSGNGHKFHVVHDMEGYYAYEVSASGTLRSCNYNVSVHYAVNGKKDTSSDYGAGEVTQYIRDAHYAWHAKCWNSHSTGTEHEGFRNNPAWFTEEMYVASASLTKHLANKFGWPKDRNRIVGHDEKRTASWRAYAPSALGIDPNCNTHSDPGPYWNWGHYINLVNGGGAPPTVNPPYTFDANAQGWISGNGLSPITWYNVGWPGIIYADQTGGDAFYYGPNASFTGGAEECINVSFYPQSGTTANHDMQFHWKTAQDNTWSASKATPMVNYTAQNAWTVIALDVNNANWIGKTINQFRLDFDQNNSGTRWIVNHVLKQANPAYFFSGGTDGWAAGNGVTAPVFEGCCGWPGIMYVDQTGNDAFITKTVSPTYRGARNDRVEVRVYPQGGTGVNHDMQLFWATSDENFFSSAKSTPINYYAAKDGWITLQFDVGANPWWSDYTGKDITQLRLDFDQANSGVRWIVDYVKVIHSTSPQTSLINNAVVGAVSAPATVNAGAGFTATVTMTNVGTTTWTTDTTPHKLGSQNPADNTTWGFTRVSLPGNVAPGQSVTFTINATAPATIGAHAFDWQMVEDGVQWFGPRAQATINVTNSVGAAPSSLAATAVSYSQINLTWADNSPTESGFKIERSPNGSSFTEIATVGANVTSYSATGLNANTTYYFRVRSYNDGGNSAYSNTASTTTPNQPPDLATIGNKTGTEGAPLTFTASASNPNQSITTTTWATFEGNNHNEAEVVFRKPSNSGTTSSFIDTTVTNYTIVSSSFPAGGGGARAVKSSWSFKTGTANYWIRLNTTGGAGLPNPTISQEQILRFKINSTKALKVGLGVRETGTTAAYGANGGTTGVIEWAAVTNVTSGHPIPSKAITANTWTTVDINVPFEPQASFTGNGIIGSGKGVLEHLALRGDGGTGVYDVYLDDFAVVEANTLTYTLDAGAPSGASIHPKTGVFAWTPSAGQGGNHTITVRVTDRLGLQDFETISVSISGGASNHKPVLAAIGNKTANEGSALTFTASATDQDAGQTLTYSLDAGNPSGSSIGSSSGAFSWTPTKAQGPGSYPITVRVTDNGSPVSNAFETITVTVNEVNTAPTFSATTDQTVNEGSTLNVTVSATDSDVPSNAITYSLLAGAPVGMAINPSSGAISWTTDEADGPATYPVKVVATDNGTPALSATNTFNVTVNEVNTAPALSVNTTATSVEPITDFEAFSDNSYNGTILFRHPAFSSTTTSFLDTTATNFTSVTTNYPGGDTISKALRATWSFKTGTTNPWMRLSTANTVTLPNPTVRFTQHLRFKIYSDKSIKIGLALRETDTGAVVGQNGGATGTMEYVGVSSVTSGMPNPTRTITASNWTTVDFDIPTEAITSFTGNGVLTSTTGKGVLETVAIIPNGGMGAYNLYFDDFEVVTITTNLAVNTGQTVTFSASATDADFPAQTLTYSLDAGAPAGATISPSTGAFSWTPDATQGPATNVITVRVTDDGPGGLSASQNVTIVVNKVNTAPKLSGLPESNGGYVEVASGGSFSFTATATDDDTPAQTLTFSLISPPSGASIGSSSGVFSWTPPGSVASTNLITVRVTDNGVPPLYDEKEILVYVIPTNATPVLSLGVARATETIVNYESFTNGTPNEQVMFKKPANSATTSSFVDTTVTNYTTVTTSFPAGNPTGSGAKALRVTWTFKTGVTNYWVRLNTLNTTFVPNPTINASARLKFDVYSSKTLKVGLGIRETGTSAENGANGGTTGNIEYVGCSSMIGSTPQPTRTVNATTWTTLEFDLPSEPCQTLTGNGILAGGQQVLEHLALVGAGGTGAYDVYFDNFQVVTTTALPGTVAMKVNSVLQFTAVATDPDPGAGIEYGLDADAPTNASINSVNGGFSWTPTVAGTTNITVFANDNPTNGAVIKTDSKSLTVNVSADTLAAQSADNTGFVAGGDTVTLSWGSVALATYKVQFKAIGATEWSDVQTVTATGAVSAVSVTNSGNDGYFRVVESGGSSE